MTLILTPAAHAEMIAAARAAHPREACGLLLGRDGVVEAATAERNVHPEPERHFEIDPLALIAAHKAARTGGAQVAGYWHSHPNGRPGPSSTDRAHATGDGRVWAIVADGTVSVWIDAPDGFKALSYAVRSG